jgi:DNA-binding winged helix-turn-helix (wHTH) protein/tetratricopeptide (TPR) repeat protein
MNGPFIFEFGPFRYDVEGRALYRGDSFVALTPKASEMLLVLLEEAGRVVTKEQLLARVWPDVIVEEGGIANNISALRKILDQGGWSDEPIATVSRRGYRFTVPVTPRPGNGGDAPRPAPATRSAPKITEKDTILIADIDNQTGDASFDGSLKQALALHLAQSPYVDVLADRRVHATLRLMGRPTDLPVNGDTAFELCRRAGAKAMVSGSIFAVGNDFVIGLQAVDTEGDILASEQARASGKDEVIGALDKAALALRATLGESMASVERYSIPLDEVATPSFEALKAYALGRALWWEKGEAVAAPEMLRATELDPEFSSAYSALASMYANMGQATRAAEFMKRSYALREKSGERERYRIEAFYHDYVDGDVHKALRSLALWQKSYPRDRMASLNSGWQNARLGRWKEALAQTEHAVETEHGAITMSNLAIMLLALGRHEEARAVTERTLAGGFDAFFVHQVAYHEAFLREDPIAMRRHVIAVAGRPGEEDLLLSTEANTEAYYGRLKASRELSRRAVESARKADAPETAAIWQALVALREAELGNDSGAKEAADATLALSQGRDVRQYAAMAYARAGDTAHAAEIASRIEKEFPNATLTNQYWIPVIRAACALREKNGSSALRLLEPTAGCDLAFSEVICVGMMYPAFLRGEAYLGEGKFAEARAEFQKLVDHPGLVLNFILAPLARLGIARALSGQGKKAEARLSYDALLALWKSADPDLALLKAARDGS